MSSSLLHTPLPPPAEGLHLRNTALAFATKTKAIDTASELLKNASRRLDRTTNRSQSEWADLLRLKRSGQWKMEARAAQVPPQGSSVLAPFIPNIPVDKMARDLCIFCGIEEAAYRWRQVGLVRLNNNNITHEKGKGKGKLSIPERLEGRRRMCIKVNMLGMAPEESKYRPTVGTPHEDDMHSALMQVQEELFEEEIFAEVSNIEKFAKLTMQFHSADICIQLIREARDQPYGITATRNTLEIRHEDTFELTISMEEVEELQPAGPSVDTSASSVTESLAHLLLIVTRLQMIQIYRKRREAKTVAKSDASSIGTPINISSSLRQLLLYHWHSSRLSVLLISCVKALRRSRIFGDDIRCDFVRCLNSPDTVLKSAMSGAPNLQGCACLTMGSQSLNLTFSGPSSIIIHLPTRNTPMRNIEDFVAIFKRIIQAALLKELETLMHSIITEVTDSAQWEVLPTPKAIGKRTPALARKIGKDATDQTEVEAFLWILPSVAIDTGNTFETTITLQVQASARGSQSANHKKTFEYSSSDQAQTQDSDSLHEWLRSSVGQL